MNIVILDGYTVNPGDLSWEPLKAFGTVTIYDHSTQQQLIERAREADILLINKINLRETELERLPNLKHVVVTATGYNNLDVQACKNYNISASNVRNYGTESVAQHTISLILELCNRIGQHHQEVISGKWSNQHNFCYWNGPIIELNGKTLGIIGLGNIGERVAALGKAFGMKVLFYNRSVKNTKEFEQTTLKKVFATSDFISLHTALSDENENLINKQTLSQMKPSAFLINTSRGGLVNEHDLFWALKNKIIAGAGIDVLTQEPPPIEHILINAPNCIITPHNAWGSIEARKRMIDIVSKNIKCFMEEKPFNLIT